MGQNVAQDQEHDVAGVPLERDHQPPVRSHRERELSSCKHEHEKNRFVPPDIAALSVLYSCLLYI